MLHQPCFARAALLLTFALVHGFGASATAGPPQITKIAPLGVRRGIASEVTVTGTNLAVNPRLIAPFPCQLEPMPATVKSDAANWKIKLQVPAEVAVGVYPIRVQTDHGISNPFLLAVGQLPQISEREDNSAFESAQEVHDLPIVIEGQVDGNDVDFFRFHGKKDQFIVIDAQCARIGSGMDPSIRLTKGTANRAYVASADDSPGLLTDARLTAVLPDDGDYVVELSDSRYQGASRPVYRLLVGAVPMAEEIYPLGGRDGETVGLELRGGTLAGVKIAAATVGSPFSSDLFVPRIPGTMIGLGGGGALSPALDVESLAPLVVSDYPEIRESADPAATTIRSVAPVVLNGRIDPPGDEDQFIVAVTPGQRVRIKVQAYEHGSALDAVLRVLGNGGAGIGNSDDTVVALPPKNNQPQSLSLPDPSLEMTIPAGTNEITLAVRDLENRGGIGFPYRIVVEPLFPDFQVELGESQVSVPRGGTAAIAVTARRAGYSGPITVTVANPPAGLTVRPGLIAAGQAVGALSFSAAADANFPAVPIKLVGQGNGVNGAFERLAFKTEVYAQQTPLPTCTRTERGLIAAPALALPLNVDAPPAPIELAHGLSAVVPVKVTRAKGAEGALTISPLPLPPGLTVANVAIADKAAEGNVTVKSALAAALGTTTVAFTAKGKIAGSDQTFSVPAVTLTIVPPATVSVAAPSIDVKPGTTAEVKGKIIRKGGFDGAVTVKINGLPAGLKAEPVTLKGAAADFAIKVVADAKAAPASTGTQVALAYQIEKKDYSVPPAPLTLKVVAK